MKKKCKKINITDLGTIKPWVADCCMRHRKRYDFKRLFFYYGMSKEDYDDAIKTHNKEAFELVIARICEEAISQIKNRKLILDPVRIREKVDTTTGKLRQIGIECPMQQVFDYIAVYSAMEIFEKRMVREQASSIPGRGQLYGVRMIQKWLRKDNESLDYAKRHNLRYSRKCKYFVKLDIKKCYPSANKEVILERFRHDCGNEDIVWLWEELFKTYEVDGYTGLLIGGLPSQWACQFALSFIYRYAKSICKRGKVVINHIAMFMDDMLFLSGNRNALYDAVKKIIAWTYENFGWEIKPEWHIRDIDKFNIDMMGYVIHADGSATIRARNFIHSRRIALRFKNMCLKQAKRLLSYKGFYKYSDSKYVTEKYHLKEIFRLAASIISKHDKELALCR